VNFIKGEGELLRGSFRHVNVRGVQGLLVEERRDLSRGSLGERSGIKGLIANAGCNHKRVILNCRSNVRRLIFTARSNIEGLVSNERHSCIKVGNILRNPLLFIAIAQDDK
jgi:hypothetical protein